MKLRFTAPARQRIRTIHRWWRENRPASPKLFVQELRSALEQIRGMPGLGQVHKSRRHGLVRRVLLPKTQQLLYYSVDVKRGEILVHIVWGAARGEEPKL